jgi:hypothetical protein
LKYYLFEVKPENIKFYFVKNYPNENYDRVEWHYVIYRNKHLVQDKFKYYKKNYGEIQIIRLSDDSLIEKHIKLFEDTSKLILIK